MSDDPNPVHKGDLIVTDAASLRDLRSGTHIHGDLRIERVSDTVVLPVGLRVFGDLIGHESLGLFDLPPLWVQGRVTIAQCLNLASLPALEAQWVRCSHSGIRTVAHGIKSLSNLILQSNHHLEEVIGVSVPGSLEIRFATALRRVERVSAGEVVRIQGCPALVFLGAVRAARIHVFDCPSLATVVGPLEADGGVLIS